MRVKGVGETKVGDDDVLVAIEEEILQLQIPVHDALLVQVTNAGDELRKEPPRRAVLQVAVVEDVVEQLAARSVLHNDANVSLGLDHLVQPDNIRMRYAT